MAHTKTLDTTTFQLPWELVTDWTWALLHQAGVLTGWHHDTDGKLTIILVDCGSKFWIQIRPRARVTHAEINQVFEKCLNADEDSLDDLCTDVIHARMLLLLPGDVVWVIHLHWSVIWLCPTAYNPLQLSMVYICQSQHWQRGLLSGPMILCISPKSPEDMTLTQETWLPMSTTPQKIHWLHSFEWLLTFKLSETDVSSCFECLFFTSDVNPRIPSEVFGCALLDDPQARIICLMSPSGEPFQSNGWHQERSCGIQ